MKVKFTEHARERLEHRKIDRNTVLETLKKPDEIYYDKEEKNFAAIKRLDRKLVIVVFVRSSEEYRIITVMITSKRDIPEKRVKSGRWIRFEGKF